MAIIDHTKSVVFILLTFSLLYLIPYIFLIIAIIRGEAVWSIAALAYFLLLYVITGFREPVKFSHLANNLSDDE